MKLKEKVIKSLPESMKSNKALGLPIGTTETLVDFTVEKLIRLYLKSDYTNTMRLILLSKNDISKREILIDKYREVGILSENAIKVAEQINATVFINLKRETRSITYKISEVMDKVKSRLMLVLDIIMDH
jgi:hypothetical protein